MNLQSQVCNLELAKQLKELGVKQESIFWFKPTGSYPTLMIVDEEKTEDYYSAFTVSELGEMLPWRSKRMGTMNNAEFVSTKLVNTATHQTIWCAAYWDEDKDLYSGMVVRLDADTEADARAKCLVYLLENGLVKAEDL